MNRKNREIEYIKLVKIHKENSPILSGFYHSLDVIDGKIQALLAYIGMQIVAITFIHNTTNEKLLENTSFIYQTYLTITLAISVFVIITSAIILVSCLNIIGPDHKMLMKDLRKLNNENDHEEGLKEIAQEVTERIAEITGSRRAKYRYALHLSMISSFLIGILILSVWNSQYISSISTALDYSCRYLIP